MIRAWTALVAVAAAAGCASLGERAPRSRPVAGPPAAPEPAAGPPRSHVEPRPRIRRAAEVLSELARSYFSAEEILSGAARRDLARIVKDAADRAGVRLVKGERPVILRAPLPRPFGGTALEVPVEGDTRKVAGTIQQIEADRRIFVAAVRHAPPQAILTVVALGIDPAPRDGEDAQALLDAARSFHAVRVHMGPILLAAGDLEGNGLALRSVEAEAARVAVTVGAQGADAAADHAAALAADPAFGPFGPPVVTPLEGGAHEILFTQAAR